MKKTIGIMLIGAITMLSAGNTAKYFEKKAGDNVGGMIDNEVIFIYEKEIKQKNSLGILANLAKQQICSGEDTRAIIEKAGMSVKFIYMQKDKSAVIVKVDDCKGVEVKK